MVNRNFVIVDCPYPENDTPAIECRTLERVQTQAVDQVVRNGLAFHHYVNFGTGMFRDENGDFGRANNHANDKPLNELGLVQVIAKTLGMHPNVQVSQDISGQPCYPFEGTANVYTLAAEALKL